jgi:hypothetical protein
MKTRIFTTILISLLLLSIAACQASESIPDEVCPIDESTGKFDEDCAPIITDGEAGSDAYPAGESAYPAIDLYIPISEDAYPVTESDLSLLLKIWRLASYVENGIKSDSPLKVLTFNADGSYTIATDTELETGSWSTILLATESTLIISPDSGEVRYYQIIELDEDALNLRSVLENVQIDEGYLPDESTCGCD